MNFSKNGIDFIKQFEGCRLTAYQDSVGVWTIGYGSTGSHVKPGKKITQAEAEALLLKDAKRFIDGVNRMVKVPLTQNQFDSLVSFCFNLGNGRLEESTLLRKLNAKDYKGAADEFLKWDKAGGKVLKGLTRRREAERALFLKAAPTPKPTPKPMAKPVVKPTPKPAAKPAATKKVEVITGALNVRKSASSKSDVVMVAKKGEVFTVTKTVGDFYQVKSGYYISNSSKYVKVIK